MTSPLQIEFHNTQPTEAIESRMRQEGKYGANHLEIKAKRKDPSVAVHAALNVARRRLKDFVGIPYKHA
jgi:hypothetical protein